MESKELAYAKQGALTVTKWDTFQAIIRRCLRGKPLQEKGLMNLRQFLLVFSLLIIFQFGPVQKAQSMTRTLKAEPAIVITAFGTTTKAQATYDFFDKQLSSKLPEKFRHYKLAWAFTSEIVRERANKKFKETGSRKRYLSLSQVLANLEDQGYRKIALQSLHIFPGREYEDMEKVVETFSHLGLRIEYGGTLVHRWPRMFEVVNELEHEFLKPSEGSNVIVAHGTPETFPGSNSAYLGLDRYVSRKYSNVFAGCVDGVLTREQALDLAKAYPVKRVRFIPFMYVAGDHIMNDIMGTELDNDGTPSWAMELKQSGIAVDTVHTSFQGKDFFKGLGFYEKIDHMFINQLIESLMRLEKD